MCSWFSKQSFFSRLDTHSFKAAYSPWALRCYCRHLTISVPGVLVVFDESQLRQALVLIVVLLLVNPAIISVDWTMSDRRYYHGTGTFSEMPHADTTVRNKLQHCCLLGDFVWYSITARVTVPAIHHHILANCTNMIIRMPRFIALARIVQISDANVLPLSQVTPRVHFPTCGQNFNCGSVCLSQTTRNPPHFLFSFYRDQFASTISIGVRESVWS